VNCGIDPGRWKIGFAAAEGDKLLFSAVMPRSELNTLCRAMNERAWNLLEEWRMEGCIANLNDKLPKKVLLGDGTSSDEIKKILEKQLEVKTVNEKGTTMEGRKLYWKLHPPAGLWRLIPTTLMTPPRAVDDLAAWAIIINNSDVE